MLNDNLEDTKFNFFSAVKNSNIEEIVKYFRNLELEPWLFKEEDEYTGIFYLINIKHYTELFLWT